MKTIVAAVPVTSAAVPVPFFEDIYIENNAAVPVGGTDRAHEAVLAYLQLNNSVSLVAKIKELSD